VEVVYGRERQQIFNWKYDRNATSSPTDSPKFQSRHERKIAQMEARQTEEYQKLLKLKEGEKRYGDQFFNMLKDNEFSYRFVSNFDEETSHVL
jgi:hypothetical protein